jgi:hypothetical protein
VATLREAGGPTRPQEGRSALGEARHTTHQAFARPARDSPQQTGVLGATRWPSPQPGVDSGTNERSQSAQGAQVPPDHTAVLRPQEQGLIRSSGPGAAWAGATVPALRREGLATEVAPDPRGKGSRSPAVRELCGNGCTRGGTRGHSRPRCEASSHWRHASRSLLCHLVPAAGLIRIPLGTPDAWGLAYVRHSPSLRGRPSGQRSSRGRLGTALPGFHQVRRVPTRWHHLARIQDVPRMRIKAPATIRT